MSDSKGRIFFGDEEIGELDSFSLLFERDIITRGETFTDSPRYVTALRERTASFMVAGVRLEDLPLPGDGARDVSLSHTYLWSKWRRWLNAVLRAAWWPLGPPRLPVRFGLNINKMYVTMAELQADGTMLRVEMSSRNPARD